MPFAPEILGNSPMALLRNAFGPELAGFDFAKRMWTIPRERAKNYKTHEVPLSDPAMELLAAIPRVSERWVFSFDGKGAMRSTAALKKKFDQAAGVRDWTLHDLRRTMVSGMARLGVRLEVIEKTVNHMAGSFRGVVGVYQRHGYETEKREALEQWAQFVLSITSRE